MPPRIAFFSLAAVTAVACGGGADSVPAYIPERDDRLAITVRYPTETTTRPGDSVAVWGDVGTGRATLTVNGFEVKVARNGAFVGYLPTPAPSAAQALRFVARMKQDSVVTVVRFAAPPAGAGTAPELRVRPTAEWVRMRRLPSDTADSATQWRPIYSRWLPGGAVALPLVQGMRLPVDARTDSALRLKISDFEHVWIPANDAEHADPSPTARYALKGFDVSCNADECDASLAIPEPVPSSVELAGDRLIWTVYRAAWSGSVAPRDGDGRTVRRYVPRDSVHDRLVLDLSLAALPVGWKSEWRDGTLRLRVRHALQPSRGLAGLRILVDAGHPPDGSTGPTGLQEDSLTLAVGQRVVALLKERGADVRATRNERMRLSVEARAARIELDAPHVFVSIHANSPGPGRPPWAVDRSHAYWMHPHARLLARMVADAVADSLGQKDRSESFGEYAVLRSPWATSILIEGLGMILPRREAFMRTREGVEAYARGIVAGIEQWSRSPLATVPPALAAQR